MSKTIPTTIEFNKTTLRNLTKLAKAEKKTISEVINDLFSPSLNGKRSASSKHNPLAAIIGIASTGLKDAALHHDTYLYKEANPHK